MAGAQLTASPSVSIRGSGSLAATLSFLLAAAVIAQPSSAARPIAGVPDHAVQLDTPLGPVPSEATDFGPEQSIDVTEDQKDVTEGHRIVVERLNSPKDFEITLCVKTTSSKAKGGVALRLQTPFDYYAVQINATSDKIVFARVSQGRYAEIAAAESTIGNAWHRLNIRAQDNRFSVTLDGRWLFTAYDAVLSRPGRVTLWTSTDGAVEFDGISVQPLGPE